MLLPAKSKGQIINQTEYPNQLNFDNRLQYKSIIVKAPAVNQTFLDPKKVMRRSLFVPGWGQITNKEAWKVPIIYGVYGGLAYYSIYLTKEYHQYRAAYYNSFPQHDDFRFGQTPEHLMGSNPTFLKSRRNELKNTRDIIYVSLVAAHLLNAVDAYVFAHLRSFDVSDDLSMNAKINPGMVYSHVHGAVPGITFTLELNK